MKKLLIASALASSALSGTAYADGTGPYITIEGGAVKNERADVTSQFGYEHADRFKTGWEAGGALGYDFGHFRLEAEGFYHESNQKSQTRPIGTRLPFGVFDETNGVYGRVKTTAVMGNVLFGLGHWGGVKAYAGGGVGWAKNIFAENPPAGATAGEYVNTHSSGFAWQALAGLTLPVSHNLDLGVKYRYFRPDGGDRFIYADLVERKVSLRSHSLLATLTYNFGAPAPAPVQEAAPPPPPPPPAPVMAPPPPPPVAVVCNKGPYIVFFDWDKSDVTPEASSILDSAVQAYGNCAMVPIMLAGYTDSSGSPKYNMGLAARRDESVMTYLTAHGIAGNSISTHAYGEANQRVPTADGVRELQNRRVEVSYGPGSGN